MIGIIFQVNTISLLLRHLLKFGGGAHAEKMYADPF